jgi:uncharacterized BrkB/YihY/UPF0761 family membrane protein
METDVSNPVTDILNAIIGGNSDVQQATGVKAATPQSNVAAAASAAEAAPSAFTSVQNALSGMYDVLTNGKMWRSLAWLLLGVMLMLVGIVLLLRKPIEGVAGDVIRSGVL